MRERRRDWRGTASFCVVVGSALALTLVCFSLAWPLLWGAMPIPNASHLAAVRSTLKGVPGGVSWADADDLREVVPSIDKLAIYSARTWGVQTERHGHVEVLLSAMATRQHRVGTYGDQRVAMPVEHARGSLRVSPAATAESCVNLSGRGAPHAVGHCLLVLLRGTSSMFARAVLNWITGKNGVQSHCPDQRRPTTEEAFETAMREEPPGAIHPSFRQRCIADVHLGSSSTQPQDFG